MTEILINETQFIIGIELILFFVFMWIGYKIPEMEGNGGRSFHYMPFSGGLFMLFAGFTFLAFSVTIRAYNLPFVQEYFTMISIIIIIYGGLKAFYYS